MTSRKKYRAASFFHTRLLSIVSITLALFILGGIALVQIAGWQIERKVKEQISFTLLLPITNTEKQNAETCKNLEAKPFVKAVRYISADEAAKELETELGENPSNVLGYNPLQPMVEVNLKSEYTHTDSLALVEEEMSNMNTDVGLTYREDLLNQVQRNMNTWRIVLWVLGALMLIVCFIQINNTTRLVIYGKRMQIRTMSLVGATPGFIQRPIIGQSVLDGLIGALLSVVVWGIVIIVAKSYLFPDILSYLPWLHLLLGGVVILVLGTIISALTSWRATRKYIRMDSGKIYLI